MPERYRVCRQLVFARLGGVSRAVDGGQAACYIFINWPLFAVVCLAEKESKEHQQRGCQ